MPMNIISNNARKSNTGYAVYLRKSRADIEAEALGEGETLARHRRILAELADRRGLTVVKTYEEIVSGESLEARPQAQMLLNAVRMQMYAGVLVVDIDRLGRGATREQGIIAEAFELSGTWIITPTKDYDPNDEADMRFLEFGQFMSRQEYKIIQKRLQRGLMQSIQEGNYVGSIPPYGYSKVASGKTKTLVINTEEAHNVKLMFELFTADHKTPGQIARQLTSMSVPTRTGKQEWHPATIKDILQNITYTGKVRWNRRKCRKEFDEKGTHRTKRRLSLPESIVVDGKHPPIITPEEFELAQLRFAGGVAPIKALTTITNPLAGLVRCAHCGRTMVEVKHLDKGKQPRLAHPQSQLCKCKSILTETLLRAVCGEIAKGVESFTFEAESGVRARKAELHASVIADAESRIKSLEMRRARLFDLLEDGTYSREEFIERRATLAAQIESAKEALEAEKKNTPEKVDYATKAATFTDVLNSIMDDSVPADAKNALLHTIIDHCEYWREPTPRGGYDKTRFIDSPYDLEIYFK